MRLATKHQGQSNRIYGDFTGGLNTAAVPEMISDRQLAECTNMGLDRSTGSLQTCCGTAQIFKSPDDIHIDTLFYDKINNEYLFCDLTTRKVYLSRLLDMQGDKASDRRIIGELTGRINPVTVMWEDGLLIASGGKLQYWNGNELNIIANSPSECKGVFVKNGRIYTWHGYRLICSGVGDEDMWEDDTNDDSSSKWLDVGYKEGENNTAYIIGVVNLSSDIVIIKADGKVYRLVGDFPNWQIVELARYVDCLNSESYCAVQDGVFVLGRNGLFLLQTTTNYGDMIPANIATNVTTLFHQLSLDTKLKYIPSLNQLWIMGPDKRIIIYDMNFQAFTTRLFNSKVNDVCLSKDTILMARESHTVVRLMESIYDDEKYGDKECNLPWSFKARTDTPFYAFFLRRMRITYVPLTDETTKSQIICANGKAQIDLPPRPLERQAPTLWKDNRSIVSDTMSIIPAHTEFVTTWLCHRDLYLDLSGEGNNSAVALIKVEMAVTETG